MTADVRSVAVHARLRHRWRARRPLIRVAPNMARPGDAAIAFRAERRARLSAPDRQERVMPNVLLDAAGRRRSPATMPGFHSGRPPRNKGRRYPADPPTVEEIVAVMRQAGTTPHGLRMHGLIVVLWRTGLRIHEALALTEADHRRPPRRSARPVVVHSASRGGRAGAVALASREQRGRHGLGCCCTAGNRAKRECG
jgi:integrase